MSRFDKCNEALNYLYDAHPHTNEFYGMLTTLGVDDKYKGQMLFAPHFDDWIKHFKNISDIEVYSATQNPYFLLFENNFYVSDAHDAIKFYVPLKPEVVNNGAKVLFEFLAKNKIEHASKIGKDVRNDAVVLRVKSLDDYDLIANFIQSTPYLRDNMLDSNPFVASKNGICLAHDGLQSYNQILSIYLSSYIKTLSEHEKSTGIKPVVDVDSFLNHINNIYTSVFVEGCDYGDTYGRHSNKSLGFDVNSVQEMADYLIITEQMLIALDKTKNVDDSLNYLSNIDSDFRKSKENDIANLSVYKKKEKEAKMDSLFSFLESIHAEHKAREETSKNELLISALMETYSKKGSEWLEQALYECIIHSSFNGFTRENNSRQILIDNFSSKDIEEIIKCKSGHLDVKTAIKIFISTVFEPPYDIENPKSAEDYLIAACIATLKKHGSNQLRSAIVKGLNCNYGFFTNDNNARINLLANVEFHNFLTVMQNILFANGFDLNNISVDQFVMYVESISDLKLS